MNAFQRFKNYWNRFIIAIILKLRKLRRCQICVRFANVSFSKIQFSTMFVVIQYDFDHNSMRQRWIFDIVDYLNNTHFVFQNEFSIVCFIYWIQMLLRCEIDRIANRMRNWISMSRFRNLIKSDSNSKNFKIFLKKIFESICRDNTMNIDWSKYFQFSISSQISFSFIYRCVCRCSTYSTYFINWYHFLNVRVFT